MALTKLNFGGNQQALVAANIPTLTSNKMPAGSVLQVIQVTSTTDSEITDSSYVHYSQLDTTITCSSTSSKVLILADINVGPWENSSNDTQQAIRIYKGGSALSREVFTRLYDYGGNGILSKVGATINHLDSPNSTSALTYQLYFKRIAGDRAAIKNGSFTLMEIAG